MNALPEASPPTNRMVIAVLSLVGFFVAFYLLAHHLGWVGSLICGVGDCAAVQASKWSSVGPVPTSAIGMVGYVALMAVSIVGLQPAYISAAWVGGSLLVFSALALAYSVFLTYLEAYVIHAWCQWCVTSAILVVVIFAASLVEIPRLRRGA
jgi:uncharacterized membrane protein